MLFLIRWIYFGRSLTIRGNIEKMRGGSLIVASAMQGVVGNFTRKIREILPGKPYVIKHDSLAKKSNIGIQRETKTA